MSSSQSNIPPIAIIGAMEQEVASLHAALDHCTETQIAGMAIYQGMLESHPVVLMQCGIGKVNAAIGTTLLLSHFKAGAVINTGSAGALAEHLQVGDVVIAQSLLHHDVDVTAFGYALGQMAQMPASYACNAELIAKAREAATAFPNAVVDSGLIISGDQFINGGAALMNIKQQFPTAVAVEMEAAAIAQVCFRFNVPFVVIRAISDNANGDAGISFDTFLDTAANHSAQMVRRLLTTLHQNYCSTPDNRYTTN